MSTLNSKFRKAAVAIAAATGLATAFVVMAQPGYGPGMMGHGGPGMMAGNAGPGMMMGGGPGMMGGGRGPMSAGNAGDMSKFQQDRLGQLKSQLGITAEQQPTWDAFAAKAAEQAKTMQAMRQNAGTGTMPERMQQRQKSMASMSESFGKLYDVLTPKQRELFDQSYGPGHRHG
jgi:hypothetical protein